PSPESIEYKGRSYSIVGGMVTSDNDEKIEDMVGFCFTDITNERNMRKSHEEKKSVECILIVDNYDEVFKDTPNANHGALIGEIERCVNEWVYQGEGISRRYERDKFIIWFENKNFEKLVANKFNVLTTIKEINLENRIPVTLSIGIGVQGETIRENDKMARLALDMALGRGGDQAVIKTPYTFNFYGANAREVEKSTKVKARVVAHALKEVINQSSNVIIMGHATGDMDSLGAAIGLFRASKNLGKDAYIALDRATTNAKILLSHFTCDEEYDRAVVSRDRALNLMDSKTLLIIVDTHRPSMVEYRGVLKAAKAVVLIDHHRRSEEFIEDAVLTYHEPYASSTSEMVTEILQYIQENKRLSPREAEALYAGIYMDTKGFTFKTGVRTFETASYLRRMGVDPVNIKRLFKNDIGAYIQKSKIITNAKIYRDNIAIAFCEDSGKDMQVIVAQAADELLNITGIEASFVLAKATNKVIISGRSLENVNVQVILEKLGGGGHITIAGAQLLNATLKMAEIELKDAIDEVLFDD
ncbi:MAG: DHH family phosphoesterase, partial [Oscillospiraceae bacterium]